MRYKIVLFILLMSILQAQSLPLNFHGNEQLNDRELYQALDLYKPYVYEFWKSEPVASLQTITLLSNTIKNFYRSKGFYHTDVTHNENGKYIDITIRENAPVRVAQITTRSKLDIQAKIPFENGTIFDADKFDESKKEIKLFYAEQGYCNTELDAKAWIDIETDNAYLMYEAVANALCNFGAIEIIPPEHVDQEIIRSLLYIKEDEPFSPEQIRKSYKSLYANEGISKAIIDTSVHDKEKASVRVTVIETEKPIRLQAGIGASSDEGLMALLGVKHRNIFGDLKTLGINTRVTEIKKTLKTDFDMPLANRNATGAELGFENERFLGFKEERLFGSIYLKQREIPHMFQESLIFDRATTYDSEDENLFPEGSLFVLSPKLAWDYDARDNILNPTQGHFLRFEAQGSLQSEVSDATYSKYKLSGGYIIPISASVIALKADFGSLRRYDGELPASYRFYTGGMNSNRAYGYRKLGPTNANGDPIGSDSVFETTAEYRFPIYGNLRGVVFNDNTFIGRSDIPDYDQGYYSAGTGLRYITPIGPIAVDFGFDVENPKEQYAFHFHIGELF